LIKVDSCENIIVITANPSAPSPFEGKTPDRNYGEVIPALKLSQPRRDTCAILYQAPDSQKARNTHLNLMTNGDNLQIHLPVLILLTANRKKCVDYASAFPYDQLTWPGGLNMYAGNRVALPFEPLSTLDTMEAQGKKDFRLALWKQCIRHYLIMLKKPATILPKSTINIKVCTSGSAPMPVELMTAFQQKKFGDARLEGWLVGNFAIAALIFTRPSKRSVVQPIFLAWT
jgi:hypothetical protein